ncbi:hypothetical protein DCS_04345 [Drechmeria coniospora]|uniref:BZIP transcription factor n=1 Tax=Drechmeria coniospora TaxID=98403 RepID=A0A151GJS2_DRECN|nr:hypothetical protein DCS_04345 [Drechmeria coniospora]KYK57336.1 hypothetical protein DCS_04345 [Drechmeria coniospora]
MARSSSAEPAKVTKKKGTRSVSTLTPQQLARKRANDREAQRAIRARTKDHIEKLEQELEELRSLQSRDKTVQDLLRRNKALEDEVRHLKENMGISLTSSPYSAPTGTAAAAVVDAYAVCQSLRRLTPCPSVYDDNISATSSGGAIPSPQMSPLPTGADYGQALPDYSQPQYVPLSNSSDAWSGLPSATIPSSVPSPSPSANDEFGNTANYIPTSMPTSMLPHGAAKDVKMEFEDMQSMGANHGYMHQQHSHQHAHQHQPSHPQQHPQHQQPRPHAWNVYPMYYDSAPQAACVSR